jgi:hypothetical protein
MREVYIGFWWGNLMERDHLENSDVERSTIVDLQEVGCGVWTGSGWLRIGTGGGHL